MLRRSYLVGLIVWDVCVIATYAALIMHIGRRSLGSSDLPWITATTVCGAIVVAAIALAAGRLHRVAAAFSGLGIGLLPSVLIVAWVLIARPGFEASAGSVGAAYALAFPSSIGGALAGVICARKRSKSVHPITRSPDRQITR